MVHSRLMLLFVLLVIRSIGCLVVLVGEATVNIRVDRLEAQAPHNETAQRLFWPRLGNKQQNEIKKGRGDKLTSLLHRHCCRLSTMAAAIQIKFAMAASTHPTVWTAFYDKNRNDGRAVKALFQQDDDALSAVAKSHTLDRNKLIATVTGSDGANLMLAPVVKKNSLEWIHQSTAFNLSFGLEGTCS
jgi:hypothetical protein